MHFLRRLSVASSLGLALVGCSHPARVVVLDQHAPHQDMGLTGYRSEVCCLNANYPGAALWLEHCYGPVSYDHCFIDHSGSTLPCAPRLGPPQECDTTCDSPSAGLLQSPCPCEQPDWQAPHEHDQPPPGHSRLREYEQSPLPEELQVLEVPTLEDPTLNKPTLELPTPREIEPPREPEPVEPETIEPEVSDSVPQPPENDIPHKTRRRRKHMRERTNQEPDDTTLLPLNAADTSEQSVEVTPQVQIPHNEVPQTEVPRNELPRLRLKLKLTSGRVEAE